MISRLVLALPSKGRLADTAISKFRRSGLNVPAPTGRTYVGALEGIDNVDVIFVSASEIASFLRQGRAHMGVTGEDLIREEMIDASKYCKILARLGFGEADVVVAVPDYWIDVHDMVDLEEVAFAFREMRRRLRVATKYVNLTREHFRKHGISDYRIVKSLGATEGAPAAGLAEVIVDISTTGNTLLANRLRRVGAPVLKSEAVLASGLDCKWPDVVRRARDEIAMRVAGA